MRLLMRISDVHSLSRHNSSNSVPRIQTIFSIHNIEKSIPRIQPISSIHNIECDSSTWRTKSISSQRKYKKGPRDYIVLTYQGRFMTMSSSPSHQKTPKMSSKCRKLCSAGHRTFSPEHSKVNSRKLRHRDLDFQDFRRKSSSSSFIGFTTRLSYPWSAILNPGRWTKPTTCRSS